MLKNYFKIAIAVLKRRKFFTFISLFGISFTLTILIVLSALFNYFFSPQYPEFNRDRSLYIGEIVKKSNDESGGYSENLPTFYFFNKYVSRLKTPACIAVASQYVSNTAMVNSKKVEIDVKYTNSDFWKVMNFEFLEGKPYNKNQVDNGEKIAVITEHIKNQYFGNIPSVAGKYIECDHMQYKVVGVVKNVPYTMTYTYANMYLPFTVTDAYKADSLIMTPQSTIEGILLANTKNDLDKISEEYQTMFSKIPIENPKTPIVISHAEPYLLMITRDIFGSAMDSGIEKFNTYLFFVLLILTLLPIVNLVNINISRILERSSEIGIRKAFGASSYNLILQFLVENIILTFIGGILSIIFSLTILFVINQSQLVPYSEFVLDKNMICLSLLAFILFGILSGVYPAWRMSRINVVTALKS